MKHTIKKLFQIIMLVSFILLSSCERDLYDDTIKNSQRELKSEIVTGREAQELISKLETSIKRKYKIKKSGNNRIAMASIGVIKYDEIIKLTDEQGKSTYTFKVDRSDSSFTKFYNLMLQEKAGGNIIKLLEYTMTSEFAEQFNETFNYKDFKGTVSTYTVINETPCPDNDVLVVHIGQLFQENTGGGFGGSNGPGSGNSSGNNNGSGTSSGSNTGTSGSGEGGSSSGSSGGSTSSGTGGGGGSQVYDDDWEIFIDCITAGNNWYVDDNGDGNCFANPRHFKMAVKPETDPTSPSPLEGESLPCAPSYHVEILTPFTKCEQHFLQTTPNKNWLWENRKTEIYQQIIDYINGDGKGCSAEREEFMNQCITQMKQNPNVFTSLTPFIIEKQIDDSQLDPCTKGVLSQLKGNHAIAKIMAKLNNSNMVYKPFYNTQIVIENPVNSTNALAQTNWDAIPNPNGPQPGIAVQSPFNYKIKIRPSYLNGTMLSNAIPPKKPTQLSIARTIIHELIHAYFDSLYDDCYYYNNCTDIKQFSDLWNDYEHNVVGNSNPISDPQHLAIANSFIKVIASALQEFQTGVLVSNLAQPDQVYIDLAWQGLQGNYPDPNPDMVAQIFNLEYPIGSPKKDHFEKTNNAEDKQESSNSNGLIIIPKSTSCN